MAKKTTKKYSYICPSCKKEQTTAIEWQTESIAYEFNLKSGESTNIDSTSGDHEAWVCPNCKEDLPFKVHEKITKMLGWY